MDQALPRGEFYPPIEPYETGRMRVSPLHELYWERCGNTDGAPVVFLHGGPGAGTSAIHRRYFDPKAYHIILLDQRGAGRSTPSAEVRENTTEALVEDLERLRLRLGIARWALFGGSWGSTLALSYALAYPERCLALVLRGIFLLRQCEVDWFLAGMGRIFPEAWRDFVSAIPLGERADILHAYHRRLTDTDPAVHLPAAQAWCAYEARCSTLRGMTSATPERRDPRFALALARIEAHYLLHEVMDGDRAILPRLDALRGIPGAIVQGRYDIVCPTAAADALARAWPEAEYIIVPDAGHSATEPGTRRALIGVMDRLKRRLSSTSRASG